MNYQLLILTLISFLATALSAQVTYNSADGTVGYVLTETREYACLINKCGEIVHRWDNVHSTDLHTKLLPNGNLMYIRDNVIYERNWDNEIVVEVRIDPKESTLAIVYEVIKLDNGNYLCVARRQWNSQNFKNIGWDYFRGQPFLMDGVVELSPQGKVVWEWSLGDHTVQGKDSSLSNYGDPATEIGKVDPTKVGSFDWTQRESFMINGMDYNPELDQIVVSVRKMGEVMIIDHSTTTEEAATSSGGRYGRGGDILYRWGDRKNYAQGTAQDKYLYYQHNPNWIQHGEDKGKMMIYNNGLNRPNVVFGQQYSSAVVIDIPHENGFYEVGSQGYYGPELPDLEIDRPTTNTDFYSGYTSSAKVAPNGNILITVGGDSRLLEVNREGDILWEYYQPLSPYIFRTELYPHDYPAFAGKELEGMGYIANVPNSEPCMLYTSVESEIDQVDWAEIIYDRLQKDIQINCRETTEYTYALYALDGRQVISPTRENENVSVDVSELSKGNYLVHVSKMYEGKVVSHHQIIVVR